MKHLPDPCPYCRSVVPWPPGTLESPARPETTCCKVERFHQPSSPVAPRASVVALALPVALFLTLFLGMHTPVFGQELVKHLEHFAGMQDRSTGSPGGEEAADYILKVFQDAGLKEVGVQKFLTPVPQVERASLEFDGETYPIFPWGPNLVYLPVTPKDGLRGPLLYGGTGSLDQLDGKAVRGAIVLIDMDSTSEWWTAMAMGAQAVVYLGTPGSIRGDFERKTTKTPAAFPRYWLTPEAGRKLLAHLNGGAGPCTIKSAAHWVNKTVRNCYGLMPGRDPSLKNELVVLDAFYDASSRILGLAPGADEATSIATLLTTVQHMANNPPDRPVLFLATVGNGQALAGMREFVWAFTTRRKILRKQTKELQEQRQLCDHQLELIDQPDPLAAKDPKDGQLIWDLVIEKAKDRADALTRELQYRKALGQEQSQEQLEEARPYRRLSWRTSMDGVTEEEKVLARQLLGEAIGQLKSKRREIKARYDAIKSANSLRNVIEDYNPVLFLSFYLSSNSPYAGLMEMGEAYPVKESIKRILRATRLAGLFNTLSTEVSQALGIPSIIRQGGRAGGAGESIGQSNAVASHPCCDVGMLAGLPTVALMSLDNNRIRWSTPNDTMEHVDRTNLARLERFLPTLLGRVISHPSLSTATEGGVKGLASLEGRAMFIRQGELFPDQPAPGTIISILQGDSIFRSMVFQDGTFFIPGLANNRVALEKLILEPYGLDPETGRVGWTADKVQTGKTNYRIKVKSDLASTSLVMFHCLQTDVVGVFAPRDMSYLTKVDLLDATTEAPPLRYWYSRVDGRDTMGISVFLEKGTRFKLVMSESLLTKDFFLINGTPESHNGTGFLIGSPATILRAPYQVARDLHTLLGDRLVNLTEHGITNQHLQALYDASGQELVEADKSLREDRYSQLWERAVAAWAKLNVVYAEIERTQRDVLTGVMFFIALFVPFAYCMERYLFAFRGIYRQLAAFFAILIITIMTIRALHPAFQLTYSPMVVIVAFFIVGLSLMVSWIIFMRFEKEMAELHSRTAHLRTPQVSKWQSFGAGFAIGVSNLNRRKLRTGLTCLTLIILTFTVMSFTSVKSLNRITHTRLADTNPYRGILLKNPFWLSITQLTLEDLRARYAGEASVYPRGWLEPKGGVDRFIARVYRGESYAGTEGILGLGAEPPDAFRRVVTAGRWFNPGETDVLLLPVPMASALGLDPETSLGTSVNLLGNSFTIIGYFDPSKLEETPDLDQNPVSPAYLETSQNEELSEVEAEAMQSGEEVLPSSGRFRYADTAATVLIPYSSCLVLGGKLKAISILPREGVDPLGVADQLASWLNYPLFVGDRGIWYHSAGSTVRYQGAANVIVPILIVVFITLNTMIGHVHERQREIGTYTSIGLAPTHVGFLFIVEALSLAVISTVIGYILAQLSAQFLAHTSLFAQLSFNYSSLSSVACMFLVFSVVFLAALYPARMAAEIAMPDVNRSWSLPDPDGDVITMYLPFLLKHEEESGVMGFLNAFFTSYQDIAHGAFIVDDVNFDLENPCLRSELMPSPVCLLIRTNVWLVPFDFGIKQRIQLHCCPSVENPGYLEIAIQLIRLSGERSAWARANRNFIKAMRKQMLLWRMLDDETKRGYSSAAA